MTNKVFLLSPSYVEIAGEDRPAENSRGSFFNQS